MDAFQVAPSPARYESQMGLDTSAFLIRIHVSIVIIIHPILHIPMLERNSCPDFGVVVKPMISTKFGVWVHFPFFLERLIILTSIWINYNTYDLTARSLE